MKLKITLITAAIIFILAIAFDQAIISNANADGTTEITCKHNGQTFGTILPDLPPHLGGGITCEELYGLQNPGHRAEVSQVQTDPSLPAHQCIFTQHVFTEPNN